MRDPTFSDALTIQARVLWALTLRDIHGKNGRAKLGYLWQLIKTGFGLSVFWWIREMAGVREVNGLPTPIFLLCGFILWFIFSDTINGALGVVKRNKALLTFSQVFPLDLHVSTLLVNWATQCVVMFLFLGIFWLTGYTYTILNPFAFLVSLFGIGIFSLGTGLMLSSLNKYISVIEKLTPMVMRILFFASGVFFSPNRFGPEFAQFAAWNPVTVYIETMRSAFLYDRRPNEINFWPIIFLTLIILTLGLLLERHVRLREEQL